MFWVISDLFFLVFCFLVSVCVFYIKYIIGTFALPANEWVHHFDEGNVRKRTLIENISVDMNERRKKCIQKQIVWFT